MDSELRRLIEEARDKTDLVDLISQSYALDESSGHYWKAVDHDSLVVNGAKQRWYWNSRGEQGDSIDWCRGQLGMTFREALDFLLGRSTDNRAAHRATPTATTLPTNMVMEAEEYHQRLLSSASTVKELMRQRNLRLATVLATKLGWHPKLKGWTIPYWDQGNTEYCTGIKVRTVRGRLRYMAVTGSRFALYTPPPLPNLRPTVLFVVEGEFKALAVMQLGAYAVGCPSDHFQARWLPRMLNRFGQAVTAVFAMRDNDLGGLTFLNRVRSSLPYVLPLAPPIQHKSIDDWIAASPTLTLPNLIEDGIANV